MTSGNDICSNRLLILSVNGILKSGKSTSQPRRSRAIDFSCKISFVVGRSIHVVFGINAIEVVFSNGLSNSPSLPNKEPRRAY